MWGAGMSEWQTLPLEECMAAIIDYRGKSPTKTTSGVPLVTAKIVKGGRIDTPEEFIAEADYDEWMSRGLPQAGDVVMTTEAPLGEVAQLDGSRIALAQRIITLRGKPGILDQTFLKFLLQSQPVQEELRSRATGTTVVGIRQSELRKVNLPLPPYESQRAIGHILGTLDDKIELNRRMNETLEAMARAIFKSWFVDFDPVRAKASGEPPESICRRLGLTPDVLALFPDGFQDSERGEIPAGWTVRALHEVIEVNPSRSLRKGYLASYLDMANMPTSSARASEIVAREFGSGMKFRNGDTLVARITPCLENGKTCFVDFLSNGEIGWGSTEYIVLRSRPPFPPEYAYFLARTDPFRSHAIANMTGTSGRQRVSATAIEDFRVVVPSEDGLATAFGGISGDVLTLMRARDAESQSLAHTRDTLLPTLLSGELPTTPQGTH